MNFSILAIFSFYFFAQLCVIACMEGNPGGKLPDKANFNEKHPGGKMRVKGTPVGKIEGQASFSGKPGGKFLDNMRIQHGNPALRAYHQDWQPYEAPHVGPITQEEINNYRRHQNVNQFPDLHAPPEDNNIHQQNRAELPDLNVQLEEHNDAMDFEHVPQ